MGAQHRRSPQRSVAVALAGAALVATSLVSPSAASASDQDGPAVDGPVTTQQDVIKQKRKRADVAAGPLEFGAKPLELVQKVVDETLPDAGCELPSKEAVAVTLAPTWPEVSGGEVTSPSPMTLSRYDNQPSLGDPGGTPGAFFNPGVGIWQLDSAGLGNGVSANEAMDVESAARVAVPDILNRYCDSLNGGADPAGARAAAWQPWHACDDGACEDTFARALEEVTPVEDVGRLGGAEARECTFRGADYDCAFVDVASAEGANWWTNPDAGQSPVPAPFYVLHAKDDNGADIEVRYWLSDDTGEADDVYAVRPFGANARDSLTWANDAVLCDKTAGRGAC